MIDAKFTKLLIISFLFLYSCSLDGENNAEYQYNDDGNYLVTPLTLYYLPHDASDALIFKEHNICRSDVNALMNKLDWNEFNIVWLENEEGDILEVGGSKIKDGFSARYVNFDSKHYEERICPQKVITEDFLKRILNSGVEKPDMVNELYFWEEKMVVLY